MVMVELNICPGKAPIMSDWRKFEGGNIITNNHTSVFIYLLLTNFCPRDTFIAELAIQKERSLIDSKTKGIVKHAENLSNILVL